MKRIFLFVLLCTGLGGCWKPTVLHPSPPQPPVTINIYLNGESPAVQYQLPGHPAQTIPLPPSAPTTSPSGSDAPENPPATPPPTLQPESVQLPLRPARPPMRVSPASTDAAFIDPFPAPPRMPSRRNQIRDF